MSIPKWNARVIIVHGIISGCHSAAYMKRFCSPIMISAGQLNDVSHIFITISVFVIECLCTQHSIMGAKNTRSTMIFYSTPKARITLYNFSVDLISSSDDWEFFTC